MNTINPTDRIAGLNLRQAAMTAGIAYFLMPVSFAYLYVFPKMIVAGDAAQTVHNISAHRELFFVGVLCHFVTAILDVIIAWALYVLLAPVNRALALFAAWLRIAYAAVYLAGVDKLLAVLHVVGTQDYRTLLGDAGWQ